MVSKIASRGLSEHDKRVMSSPSGASLVRSRQSERRCQIDVRSGFHLVQKSSITFKGFGRDYGASLGLFFSGLCNDNERNKNANRVTVIIFKNTCVEDARRHFEKSTNSRLRS